MTFHQTTIMPVKLVERNDNMNNKSSIVKLIAVLQQIAEEMAESDINTSSNHNEEVVEMLTINECIKRFDGLRESSLRAWVRQGKLPAIRAGKTQNGKILINSEVLCKYLYGELENNNG